MYRAIPVGNVLPEKILYPAASLRSQNRKMYLSYDPPLAIFCCDGDGIFLLQERVASLCLLET